MAKTIIKSINYLFGEDVSGEYFAVSTGHIIHVQENGDTFVLKPRDNGNKYMSVSIENKHVDGQRKSKMFYVHRLIAMAFIPNPDNLPQVNHKDYNVQNNAVENLEWLSAHDNTWYSREHFLEGRKNMKPRVGRSGEPFIITRIKNGRTYYRVKVKSFPETRYKKLEDAIRKRDELLGKINNAG